MRLFVALDINEAIREKIATFVQGVRGFAPDARWVRVESLHVTLKFIGERPPESLAAIQQALAAAHSDAIHLAFRGSGFFPNPKSARVFWVGITAGEPLAALAGAIDQAMETTGVPRETHAFAPHLTLARSSGGSGAPGRQKGHRPNSNFQKLQDKLAALPAPEFGTMTAREFFLYESKLSPQGSHYSKLARFALGADPDGTGHLS